MFRRWRKRKAAKALQSMTASAEHLADAILKGAPDRHKITSEELEKIETFAKTDLWNSVRQNLLKDHSADMVDLVGDGLIKDKFVAAFSKHLREKAALHADAKGNA